MVERVLNVHWYYVPEWRELSAFAQQDDLSLFANAETVDLYRRAGPPYDATSLMTAVTSPKDGGAVKGVVALLASASSDYGVAKVGFVVSGSTGYRRELSGTQTPYGWLAGWNSTGLPNGRYVIRSVAHDRASHRANSGTVDVFLGG